MKKITCMLLALLLITALAVPVLAAPYVVFTSGSRFEVGGTAKVDIETMINQDSEMYNAFLEGQVSYTWYKNGSAISNSNSPSRSFTQADAGAQFYVVVNCGLTLTSDTYTVAGSSVYPTITTKELPAGTVGVYYDFQIQCADKNATFEVYRSPDFHMTGLTLSASGRLTGTPTQSGMVHFNIKVTGSGGEEEYEEYDFVIGAAVAKEPEITTTKLPKAAVGQKYYVKLQCTDPDATFHEYYNPGKANDLGKTGLTLTQHGELEGTPKTAGSFTFTVCAAGEGGEGYRSFTLTVEKAEVKLELIKAPDKTTYKAGEELDLTGLKVKITKEDGKTVESDGGDMLTVTGGGVLEQAGAHTVTLTYEGVSVTFTVQVEEAEVTEPTEETEEPTESAETTEKTQDETEAAPQKQDGKQDDEGIDTVLILIIVLVVVVVVAATVIVLLVVSKKKK